MGLSAAVAGGTPLVITLHEPGILGPVPAGDLGVHPACWLVLKVAVGWVVRLGVVAVPLKSEVERLRREFPGGRIVHVPHGTFHRPEALPEPPDPSVMFFGFLAPYKGLPTLAAAFRRLRERRPGATLEIAGAEHPRFPGYARALHLALAETAGLRWSGPVPEDGLRAVFERNTVVVLPYRAALGASSVLYRAATWGRPVVATDLPALRAAAAEGGLWVNWTGPDDVAGLAGVLGALLDQPELRECQRRQNLQAVSFLSVEAVADAYTRLLARVAGQKYLFPTPEWG